MKRSEDFTVSKLLQIIVCLSQPPLFDKTDDRIAKTRRSLPIGLAR
jgi:hypothetical protein